MHIKYIHSNIKNGVNCELGRKTLIVGPNMSGKTSVLQALELALVGTISDAENRDEVKSLPPIIRSFGPSESAFFSVATVSDDTKCVWSYKKVNGKLVKQEVSRPYSITYTSRELLRALKGSASTIQSLLVPHLKSNMGAGEPLLRTALLSIPDRDLGIIVESGVICPEEKSTPHEILSKLKSNIMALKKDIAKDREKVEFLLEGHTVMDPIEYQILSESFGDHKVATKNRYLDHEKYVREKVSRETRARCEKLLNQCDEIEAVLKLRQTARKSFEKVVTELFEERAVDLFNRANAYLHPVIGKFYFDTKTYRVGVERPDGLKITSLPGAAMVSAQMALASAMYSDPSDMRIMTAPDIAWDPETLSMTMQALRDTSHQVILTSTVMPWRKSELKGWKIITLR
jgi:energy-coupling factor transporter ATP-binding protein EcfA2